MKLHKHLALNARRKRVLERLKTQLVSGVKPVKKNPGTYHPLNEGDIKRITKEILILEGPIMKYRRKNRKYDTKGIKIGAV